MTIKKSKVFYQLFMYLIYLTSAFGVIKKEISEDSSIYSMLKEI